MTNSHIYYWRRFIFVLHLVVSSIILIKKNILMGEKDKINSLITDIEKLNGKNLSNRSEISMIIETSKLHGMVDTFNRLIFLGKFLFNTHKIMNKTGKDSEGYEKLSNEFQDNSKLFLQDLEIIIEASAEDTRDCLLKFISFQNTTDFNNFMMLIEDLSLLKNYEIDTHRKILEDLN